MLKPAEMDRLVSDLLSSTEHDAGRDVVAAGVIANLRDEIAALRKAADRLADGASGNGSRMTVSKADLDRLIRRPSA